MEQAIDTQVTGNYVGQANGVSCVSHLRPSLHLQEKQRKVLHEMSESAYAQRIEAQKQEDQRAAKSATNPTSKGHGRKRQAQSTGGKSKTVPKVRAEMESEDTTMEVAVTPDLWVDTEALTPVVVSVATNPPDRKAATTEECEPGGKSSNQKPNKNSR